MQGLELLARQREEGPQRPEPPSASDIVAGPGEPQVITLEGDPRDPKNATSALNAAKRLSALHDQQAGPLTGNLHVKV
jgi:hypothetical protein